ncbi:MAG: Shedu anti-phage system protein SduA domain-containing protein [Bacteroidota bacterium]
MQYKLTIEEERVFWEKVEYDLKQAPFAESPSQWNTKTAGIFQEKMHEKFIELYKKDKKINYLLEIEDYDDSPLLRHAMTSSILNIFRYKTSRTTLPRIKNRFTIYLRNQSADEYIEANNILSSNNRSKSNAHPLDDLKPKAEQMDDHQSPDSNNPTSIRIGDLDINVQEALELVKRKLTEEPQGEEGLHREKILQEYEQLLQQSATKRQGQREIFNFFEKNPSLLPGLNGNKGNLTHGAHHGLIFPELALHGTHSIRPDFLFVATNSLEASIVFIKIDQPSNRIFTEKDEFTAEFNQAFSQLEDWNHWMSIDENKAIIIEELTNAFSSNRIKRLNIKSEHYLVISRRLEYLNNPNRQRLISLKSKFPYHILSFDRLAPYATGNSYLPVRKSADHSFFATYISNTYDYSQMRSIIHGHINKKEAILNQQHLTQEEKEELLKEVNYWDSFDDPIQSALAAIKRKSK